MFRDLQMYPYLYKVVLVYELGNKYLTRARLWQDMLQTVRGTHVMLFKKKTHFYLLALLPHRT